MNYFLFSQKLNSKGREWINLRRKRKSILKKPKMGKVFSRGDILTVNFWAKTYRYHFEGICLSLKKKTLSRHNTTLVLRNVLFRIGVELTMSYYSNRLFRNTFMSDYKRKNFNYRSAKLYYLRSRENQATRIK